MSFIDSILDKMGLGDDYYDEDDEFYDDEEDYEEEPPKKARASKKASKQRDEDLYDDTYDDYDDVPAAKPKAAKQSKKVTPINASRRRGADEVEVCVMKPSSVEDSSEITTTLLRGRTVVLNLEGLDIDIAQRIIDFTSGSCFAIDGDLKKISNYIFIITPKNVDLTGDFQDILNGTISVSAFRKDY